MIAYLLEHKRYLNLLGVLIVLGVSWLLSSNRARINYYVLLKALALQVCIAFLTLKTSWGYALVSAVARGITHLYTYSEAGSRFLFGPLMQVQDPWGFVFAFRVLPIVIFFGAFIALLFHYRIIQLITGPINYVFFPLLGTSAAETLCAIANSFLGQTEAPLLIRKYLATMTRSEILTVMISGMGTMSAPLLAVYAAMGVPLVYLLSASVMAVPGTILISKILIPETQEPVTRKGLHMDQDQTETVFDALYQGTFDGLQLALNIGAMLIAFVALIALANGLLGWASSMLQSLMSVAGIKTTIPTLTLESIFGIIFAPIGWLFGLTGHEIMRAGELLGIKLTLNEMIAYATLVKMKLSVRAVALLSFALAGFANFSSIGIQVGGIGALAPGQRKTLAQLGLKAVLGGTLSNLLSAFIAGLML